MYMWAADERTAPWGIFAAGSVIAAIPVILLFQYLQKYIVSGLTAAASRSKRFRASCLASPGLVPYPRGTSGAVSACDSREGRRSACCHEVWAVR